MSSRIHPKLGTYRRKEEAAIYAFLLAMVFVILILPHPDQILQAESDQVQAFAYGMPGQGWAPLTVFFSAFGSHSDLGQIAKYEWDLDGNGRFDTDATATSGYASYRYLKPGEYRIMLRVTDDSGRISMDQLRINIRHPASSSVDYWKVFDDREVRRVQLQFTQANWDQMWADPSMKTRVEADVDLFGETVRQVAVSMKGNGSLWDSGDKKSWKIDTNYFVDGQEFRNLKQLLFHNNFADASMLREKMAYDMMAFAGVPASHTSYVEIWIDITDDGRPAEYWGVYTMVERVDSKFVSNRFSREAGVGNLYKADAWFEQGGADLAYYGMDINQYPKPRGEIAYGLQTNLKQPDYSDIVNLCYVLDGQTYPTSQDFVENLESVFNVDGFLRYMAVIFNNLNLDSYPYTGNNYYLYHDPTIGRFEFLPWDLNNSWGHFNGQFDFPFYGEPCCVGPLSWAPLFSKVFDVPQYRQDYAAYVDLLTRHWFNENQVSAMAAAWQEMVGPFLTKETGDKMYVGSNAMFSISAFTSDRKELIDLTAERSRYLRQVIDSGEWRTIIPASNTKP